MQKIQILILAATLFPVLAYAQIGSIVQSDSVVQSDSLIQADSVVQSAPTAIPALKIEVRMAYPQAGRSVNLSSGYTLELKDNKVSAYLPFYGRAYNLPYGEGGGFDFEEEEVMRYQEKEVMKHKKTYTEISFQVNAKGDTVTFHLTLFPGGNISLSVTSNNRAPISYTGEVVESEAE